MLDEHEGLPGPNQSQTNQAITEGMLCYSVKNTYLRTRVYLAMNEINE